MAIARPPSVIVLMVTPKPRSTRIAAASDSGIAVSVIAAARVLARKISTTAITRMPPSRSAVDHVVHRDLDEVGLAEDAAVDRDPRGQLLLRARRAPGRAAR